MRWPAFDSWRLHRSLLSPSGLNVAGLNRSALILLSCQLVKVAQSTVRSTALLSVCHRGWWRAPRSSCLSGGFRSGRPLRPRGHMIPYVVHDNNTRFCQGCQEHVFATLTSDYNNYTRRSLSFLSRPSTSSGAHSPLMAPSPSPCLGPIN